ncbi:MAG: CopD family protein [Thermoplasmatales archaeon]|nr:CopD family protein [Thermoplasmatales archaeon]
MTVIDILILWIHIFAAIIFVGGSFFIWLVVWPVSYTLTDDEKERTRIVGKIAKRFAYFTHSSLLILIITGIYNTTWYLRGDISTLTLTTGGRILLVKSILVIVVIAIIYSNNLYHGKLITRLVSEGKLEKVVKIRKRTHMLSFISLGLLLAITGLATALQFY